MGASYFGAIWTFPGMLDHAQKNDIINLEVLSMSSSVQKIKTKSHFISVMLLICYFKALWTCPDMPDHTQ